ncbi:MAG: protein kinase domain-containing protein [Planctomycetota bacterium]|jgi:CheY-like chemotaxis protein
MLVRPGAVRQVSVRTDLGPFRIAVVAGTPSFGDGEPCVEGTDAAPAYRGSVVVTDDSMVMRKNIARMLSKAGYEIVAEARNGREAVEHFRRHRPDVMTMDINMPVMGGLDALRIIRAEDPSARVLLCSAIAESGIVNRGLSSGAVVKPSNLVFGEDGMVKVTDFGIAQKAGTEDSPTISQMVGTPCFMSPEQVQERPIDHRADIYSLGTTLYYLLTGDPPYDGDDGVETALRQVHDPVPQIPGAPRKLNRLLAKMMAKSPDKRHSTYNDLLNDIERLV